MLGLYLCKDLMKKLPVESQDKLMLGYMYKGFLNIFIEFFRILKDSYTFGQYCRVDNHKRSYYCWKDKDYRDFICHILVHLEPFRERKYVKIIEELDEFTTL